MTTHCIKRAILLMVSLLWLSFGANANALTPRIVGGSIVPDNRYPFMVSIHFDPDGDGFFAPGCGGSLVASRWVVTAAHCVVDRNTGAVRATSEVAVFAGNLNLATQTEGVLIVSNDIIVHPGYDARTFVSDIALIELNDPVNQIPISLPVTSSGIPTVAEQAIVAGWGHTTEGGVSSNLLREVSLPVLSHAACLPFYQSSLRTDANVCAGGARNGGRDACQGDSGGPLFVARENVWVLAGIVSYGEGCARPDIPGVYTRVTSYTDWVASIVPGLQTFGTAAVTTNDEQAVNSAQLLELTTQTPFQSGSLLTGEVAVYELKDADRVDLTSLTGDADLYVFQGVRFESEDVICISDEFTPLDFCDLPDTNDRLFAGVYSYVTSNYEIRISSGNNSGEEVTQVEGDVAPGAAEVTPGEEEVAADVTPGAADVTPGEEEVAPGAGDVAPGEEGGTPVAADVTPGEEVVTPVAGDVTPGEEGVTPVAGDMTLASGEVTPVGVDETPVDVVESGIPPTTPPIPANDSDIAGSPFVDEGSGSMGGLALLLLGCVTFIRRYRLS